MIALVSAIVLAIPPADAARVGIGIGIGVPFGGYSGPYGEPYGYGPRYIYAPPPTVVVQSPPPAAVPRAADPIFYPKDGQSPAQTEADRQECNRWAVTQPTAMAQADAFQRATYACMEGHGYTVR